MCVCVLCWPYQYSLSIMSPKPGVSTTVSEILTPSSSSSVIMEETRYVHRFSLTLWRQIPSSGSLAQLLTDRVRLDLDALFDMCHFWLITLALGHHVSVAQSVDEGGTTKTRCTCERNKSKRAMSTWRCVEQMQNALDTMGHGEEKKKKKV